MKNILLFILLLVNNVSDGEPKEIDSRELVYKDAEEGLKISFESSVQIRSIERGGTGLGSGNLISHMGELYVITANHVVEDALFLEIIEKDGNIIPLIVV